MIDVTPLKAPFGAEVRGWEPGRALTDSEEEVLRNALHTYVLLVLRGHPRPSNEEFARLGEVMKPGAKAHRREVVDLTPERVDAV